MGAHSTKCLLGCLWMGLILCGCGNRDSASAGSLYDGPRNSCRGAGDCGGRSVCDKTLSMCVRTDDLSEGTYLIRVKPAGRDAEVFEVSPEGQPHFLTLRKPEAVTVETYMLERTELADGGVLEEETPVRLSGAFVVRDMRRRISDQDPSVFSKLISRSTVSLSLRPGEDRYSFEIVPDRDAPDSFPPQYWDNVSVDETSADTDSEAFAEGENGQTLKFLVFPDISTLAGKIKRGPQPVDGVTVEAIDPETGRTLSSPARTTCIDDLGSTAVCGEFDLGLVSEDTPFYLKISRPEESRYPKVIRPDLEVPLSGGRKVFTLDPLPAPIRYQARVEKPVVLESGNVVHDGLPGCYVVFESEPEGIGGGQVSVTAITDQSGALTTLYGEPDAATDGIDLYPGIYRVTVIPPDVVSESLVDYSVLQEVREIGNPEVSEITNQVFSLSFRTLLRVRVTREGESIPGATIVTEPLDEDHPSARRSHSFVDADGRLAVWLDPGRHLVTAQVPAASGYAFSFREISVPENPLLYERPLTLDIQDINAAVPNVEEVFVRSTDPDVDMVGAQIEWFRLLDVTDDALLVGRTTVGEGGKALVFLPSPAALEN